MVRSWDVAADLPAVDLRPLFSAERQELVKLLRTLSSEQWRSGTACKGWSVHDIALHLLGNDFGRTSPPSRKAMEGTETFAELASTIEISNERWVRSARRIAPEVLPELLMVMGARVDEAFEALDLDRAGIAVLWTGTGPSPVWLDIAREYTERWVHQAQIREAVGAAGLIGRRWLHPVLDTFMRSMPRAFEDVTAAVGSSVGIVVRGRAGGAWRLERDAERWRLTSPRDEVADASVAIPVDAAWRLLTRIGNVDAARRSAGISGDAALAKAALTSVAVMTTRL